MDRLGRSWAELGRGTADCSKAISRTECQQSAQAQSVHPSFTKMIVRLVRSWAEIGTWKADCPEQSTLPRTNSRPRRNRNNLLPLEEVAPDASRGYDYEVINAISQDIWVAGRPSHVADLAEIRCRPLRQIGR